MDHLQQPSGKGKDDPDHEVPKCFAVVFGGIFPVVVVVEYPKEGYDQKNDAQQNKEDDQDRNQVAGTVPLHQFGGKVQNKTEDNPRSRDHGLSVIVNLVSFHRWKLGGLGEKMQVGGRFPSAKVFH